MVQNKAFDCIMYVYDLGALLGRDMKKVSDSELIQAERVLGLALANAGAVETLESALNEEYTKTLMERGKS